MSGFHSVTVYCYKVIIIVIIIHYNELLKG